MKARWHEMLVNLAAHPVAFPLARPPPPCQGDHRMSLDLITLQEAAARLGVNPKTIRRRIADGTLTAFQFRNVSNTGAYGNHGGETLFATLDTERPDLVGYHPDVRIFEVTEEGGAPVGLYLLDLYTRDSKRGGAWMNPKRSVNSSAAVSQ